jgi:monooxygenase
VTEPLDVLIIGAGLSGIGVAARLRKHNPWAKFEIFEARADLGGTWDLFGYPGVRSDSDMYTLGYPFRVWRQGAAIADGAAVLRYLRATAAEYQVTHTIQLKHRVHRICWNEREQLWQVEASADGQSIIRTARFVVGGTGYYNHEQPYVPAFPGRTEFLGRVVLPQMWPTNLLCSGKKVTVVGSGATAVTIAPAIVELGGKVTLIQRSPTWLVAVPTRDKWADHARAWLPERCAYRLNRWKNSARSLVTYWLCRRFPQLVRQVLLDRVRAFVGVDQTAAHFTPTYAPWDQRICAAPNGDFLKAVADQKVLMVTDEIAELTATGVRVKSGDVIETDILVLATGLNLQAFGGIKVEVGGHVVPMTERYIWRSAMVSGVPNFAFCFGYATASWTLRSDLTARLICRLLTVMRDQKISAITPRAPQGLKPRPIIGLTSRYVLRGLAQFPAAGDRGVWKPGRNYLIDYWRTLCSMVGFTLVLNLARKRGRKRGQKRGLTRLQGLELSFQRTPSGPGHK